MIPIKVGKKVWFTVDETSANVFLTRREARENKSPEGVLIEVPISYITQKKLQGIADSLALRAGVI